MLNEKKPDSKHYLQYNYIYIIFRTRKTVGRRNKLEGAGAEEHSGEMEMSYTFTVVIQPRAFTKIHTKLYTKKGGSH